MLIRIAGFIVMPDREIENLLKDEVDTANRAFHAAIREFRAIEWDIPSGRHPDGIEKIKTFGNPYNFAMDAYTLALREFNAFIINGIIPERLKDRANSAGGGR